MDLERSTSGSHSNPDIPGLGQTPPPGTLPDSGCLAWHAGVDVNVSLDPRSPTSNSLSPRSTSKNSKGSQFGQRDPSPLCREQSPGVAPASPNSAASGGKRGAGLAAGGQEATARTSKSSLDSNSTGLADPSDSTGILADLVAEKVSLHETLASSIVKHLSDRDKSPASSFCPGDSPSLTLARVPSDAQLSRRPSAKAFSQSCSLAVFASERQCISTNNSRRNSKSSSRPLQEAIGCRLGPQGPAASTNARPRRFSVSSTSMFGDLESVISEQLLQGLSAHKNVGSPTHKNIGLPTHNNDSQSDAGVSSRQVSPDKTVSSRPGSVGKSHPVSEDYAMSTSSDQFHSSELTCSNSEAPVWDLALDDTFRPKPLQSPPSGDTCPNSLGSTAAGGQSVDFRGVDSLRQSNTDHVVRRSLSVKDHEKLKAELYSEDYAASDLDDVFCDDPCYKIWMPSMLLLRICGVLPWCLNQRQRERRLWRSPAAWYQWLILSIAALGVVTSLYPIFSATSVLQQGGALCYSEACLKIGLLSDVPLAFGALLGLISLGALFHSQRLGEARQLMQSYAMNEQFSGRWAIATRRDLVFVLLLWFVAVLERIRGTSVTGTLDTWAILHITMFSVNSLILVAIALCMLYICQGLICAVDAFCLVTILGGTLDEAVPKWNMVQAMLRKGSASIQACLAILQATVIFTFFLGAVDVYQSAQQEQEQVYTTLLIPGALLPLGVLLIFFKASNVTDRCARVPSLLNSITWEDCEEMDMQRQYVVQYVLYSEPGFYIFEILMTSRMTLQFAYVIMIGMFYVVSNTLVRK